MKQNRKRRGFTILELVAASAVSIILLALFLTVSSNILDVWGEGRDTLSSNAKARLILNTLASDLESAVLRNDTNTWLVCEIHEPKQEHGWIDSNKQKPDELIIEEEDKPESNKPLAPSKYRFGTAGVWLRFFSSPQDANNEGDINAVAYQLIRDKPIGRATTLDTGYSLFRTVINGENTVDAVKEVGGYKINQLSSGGIINPASNQNLLAKDVVDFGIILYRLAVGEEDEVLFPTSKSTQYQIPYREENIPDYADIVIRILDEEGVKRINAYERDLIPTENEDYWWETAEAFSTVYTRRVIFKSKGL